MSVSSIKEPLFIKRSKQVEVITLGAKVGATAGWVVGAATNVGRMATIPASQSASTLVVPLSGLRAGDIITGFGLLGQVESAAGTVTIDAALWKMTRAAADITNAAVTGGGMTQVSVTADTAIDASNAYKELTAPEVVGRESAYYLLITATTAASTDIDLMGVFVELTTM